MAKFYMKIVDDSGLIIDDVLAEFPQAGLEPMIGACEELGHLKDDGTPITGGRAVTYALRFFLFNLAKDYTGRMAAKAATLQVYDQFDQINKSIEISDNPGGVP